MEYIKEEFYDKEYLDRLEIFNKELLEIEEINKNYFKDDETLDKHYLFENNRGDIRFAFKTESKLPENIKSECLKVYKRFIYGQT